MFEIVIAQAYPATPTAYPPPGTPVLQLPSSEAFGLWSATDDVIGYWNLYSDFTQFIPYIVFAVLIVASIFLLRRLFYGVANDTETAPAQKVNVNVQQPRRPMFRGAARRRRR